VELTPYDLKVGRITFRVIKKRPIEGELKKEE
jgi:hypothetical protein